NPEAVYKMLEEGSKKANAVAEQTLKEVRDAMGINYFN
ncbi:MAG: tryptophan--tRNA ligase, partial [Latilactobacillus curvatus]